ncbi:MAG: hypothetical protein ACK52I_14365, partial [Pseudomonadota bacterium]
MDADHPQAEFLRDGLHHLEMTWIPTEFDYDLMLGEVRPDLVWRFGHAPGLPMSLRAGRAARPGQALVRGHSASRMATNPFVPMGNSLGGCIAATMAAPWPRLMSHRVLIDTAIYPKDPLDRILAHEARADPPVYEPRRHRGCTRGHPARLDEVARRLPQPVRRRRQRCHPGADAAGGDR